MRLASAAGLRRGGALALVLCLFLALGSMMLGAVTLAATAGRAAERDYRRSQALALAEAGIAEARAGLAAHGPRELGPGRYSWTSTPGPGGRSITARGEVASTSGVLVTRTIRAKLTAAGQVRSWSEGR